MNGPATSMDARRPAGRVPPRAVGWWLLACAALVYAMVVVGGVTRLTGSGLSMVRWHPISGALPPIGEAAWQREFDAYRASPEYRQVNRGMSLAQFKRIFRMEYAHRMLGRGVGLAFLIPFLVFLALRAIPRAMIPQLAGVFVLGAAQGVLGWYMVRSGLVDEPRVSQYRLAAHLSLAVVIYVWLLVLGLRALDAGAAGRSGSAGDAGASGRPGGSGTSGARRRCDHAVEAGVPGRDGDTDASGARGLRGHVVEADVPGRRSDGGNHGAPGWRTVSGAARWLVLAAGVSVFATLVMGAFVAGLKAGHVYPTFPKMGGFWAPPGMLEASPWWRNFFENPVTVQFTHRVLAFASCLAVTAAWGACLGAGASRQTRLWANASLALIALQVALGVSTVLLHVPIPLAAGHQAGAVALLTCLVGLYRAASAPRLVPPP